MFEYDRVNGGFISRHTGKPVGWLAPDGYKFVRIDGANYSVHRLVWLVEHGALPPVVDHIDRNPANNHISNLRASSKSTNAQNAKMPETNTSGAKGVSWSKRRRKWHAYVKVNGKREFSQHVDSFEDAAMLARQARERLHGEFYCHGDTP